MKDFFDELKTMVEEFGTAPVIEDMPRRTLQDKGINGPTAAHVIEEVHSPLNLAYLTFTTGSSAFQNIVGVTHTEMDDKVKASHKALEIAGIKRGGKILFTYPPLVNVFTKRALDELEIEWQFLRRSSRDSFLSQFYEMDPDAVLGESSFLRVALEDAKNMGIAEYLPKGKALIVAGTPLDLDLLDVAESIVSSRVHDLYGCQEFGWLTIDGIPVRDDLSLIKSPSKGINLYEVVVGGLPMGDTFAVSESGHVCNSEGKIITYRRKRTHPEYEVIVKATKLSSAETIGRVARTILRLKSRVVKVDPEVQLSAENTVLEYRVGIGKQETDEPIIIEGPEKTRLFDKMIEAQIGYQQGSKSDPTWIKRR